MTAQTLHLSQLRKDAPGDLASGDNVRGDVMIAASAKVDPTAVIGPNVIIGENCVVGAGTKI